MHCTDSACLHDSPSLLKISATDHANITQYFPCIDRVSRPPYISEIGPILQPHRKKTRLPTYSSLPCSPPSHNNLCFRGVYDGFDEFVNYAHEKGVGDENLIDRVGLLLEDLILHPAEEISPTTYYPLFGDDEAGKTKPTLLALSAKRQITYEPSDGMANYAELHADYLEFFGHVYSAILYDEPSDDLLGGETGFVDFLDVTSKEEDGSSSCSAVMGDKIEFGLKIPKNHELNNDQEGTPPLELTSGIVIEPKRGRLVVFSGGGENFHAPMEVRRGERPTYHFWFKCKK